MLDFEGVLLDLTLTDENDLPEDLELSCVLAVMQAVFCKDVADRLLRIYKKLKPKLNNPHYQERWIKLLRYMLSSSKYLTEEDVMEVKNQMSDTDEVLTISPFAQTLLARGEANSIIKILTRNFGELPFAVCDKLYASHDLDVLDRLMDVALDCRSPAEFEQALNQ